MSVVVNGHNFAPSVVNRHRLCQDRSTPGRCCLLTIEESLVLSISISSMK